MLKCDKRLANQQTNEQTNGICVVCGLESVKLTRLMLNRDVKLAGLISNGAVNLSKYIYLHPIIPGCKYRT